MKMLYRSEKDRKWLGVCSGWAAYYGVDPTLVRSIAVIVAVLTAFIPALAAYLVLALVMPTESEVKSGKKKR